MGGICILTDNAAQFTQPGFSGRDNVRVIPFSVRLNGSVFADGEGPKSISLPPSANDELSPALLSPDPTQLAHLFQGLQGQYNDLIAVLTSSELAPLFHQAELAAEVVRGQIRITLIDSQTTSLGLGMLVQIAAESVAKGMSAADVERRVRSMIPRTYSLFACAGLTYLHHAGSIDESQAGVGEMLGVLPIFSLEEGKISPIEKSRNPRGILDFFQEFLGEFDDLQQIAFLQGSPPFNHESHMLREHAQLHFPRTPFTEHTINLPSAVLFGPRTLGLVIIEGE